MADGNNAENITGYAVEITIGGSGIRAVIAADSKVSDIIIPDNLLGLPVTEIDCDHAYRPSRSKNIKIPAPVQTLSDSFRCGIASGNYQIEIDENNTNFIFENGALYNSDRTELILFLNRNAAEFTVPDFVNVIGNYAFMFSSVERVVLNKTVDTINKETFAYCEKLKDIDLRNIKYIGDKAFYRCSSLSRIGTAAEHIGSAAFHSCEKLEFVKIPYVRVIESRAFNDCRNLKKLMFSDSLCSVGDRVFGLTNFPNIFHGFNNKKINRKEFYVEINVIKYDQWGANFLFTGLSRRNMEIVFRLCVYSGTPVGLALQSALVHSSVLCNFKKIDDYLTMSNKQNKYNSIVFDRELLTNAILRLKYPYTLSNETRENCIELVRKKALIILREHIRKNDIDALQKAVDYGLIHEKNIITYIDECAKLKQTECTSFLLDIKNKKFPNCDDLVLE